MSPQQFTKFSDSTSVLAHACLAEYGASAKTRASTSDTFRSSIDLFTMHQKLIQPPPAPRYVSVEQPAIVQFNPFLARRKRSPRFYADRFENDRPESHRI